MNPLLKVLEKALEKVNEIAEKDNDAVADLHAVPLEHQILAAQNLKYAMSTV